MLLTAYAIIAAVTGGGIGALWYSAKDSDKESKKSASNDDSFESSMTSGAEWSVYL